MGLGLDVPGWLVNNLKISGFKDILLIFILNLIQKEIQIERGLK